MIIQLWENWIKTIICVVIRAPELFSTHALSPAILKSLYICMNHSNVDHFVLDKGQHNANSSDNSIGPENAISCNEKTSNDGNFPVDIVSAAIMAKVLKEREKERSNKKHCRTCSCVSILNDNKSCQTEENSTVEVRSCSCRENCISYLLRVSFYWV